jgi:hypothetical protein
MAGVKKFLREVQAICAEEGMPVAEVIYGKSHTKAVLARKGQTRMIVLSITPSDGNVLKAVRREVIRHRRDIDAGR